MYSIYDPTTLTQAFALSRQGSSHKRARPEKPCQDSCGVFTSAFRGEGAVAVVAADGHGSAPHDRSDLGSQLAVQAAGAVFMEFVVRLADETSPTRLVSDFQEHFPKSLVQRWRELVKFHANGVANGTGAGVEAAPGTQTGEALWKRYGTTLLFAGAYRGYLFLAQLGDGVVVIQRADGKLECPIPEDDSHYGGSTHSLCAEDARRHIHTTMIAHDAIKAVVLCSDGVPDSFATREKMFDMLGSILGNRIKFGLGPALDIVPDFLDRASTYGSGDDMTVAGLVFLSTEASAAKEPAVVEVVEVVEVEKVVEVEPEVKPEVVEVEPAVVEQQVVEPAVVEPEPQLEVEPEVEPEQPVQETPPPPPETPPPPQSQTEPRLEEMETPVEVSSETPKVESIPEPAPPMNPATEAPQQTHMVEITQQKVNPVSGAYTMP